MSNRKNKLEFKINGRSYVAEYVQIMDKDQLDDIHFRHDRGTDPSKINGYVTFLSPYFIDERVGKYYVCNDLVIEGNIEEYSKKQLLSLLFQNTQYKYCPLEFIMTRGQIYGTKTWLNDEIDDIETIIEIKNNP